MKLFRFWIVSLVVVTLCFGSFAAASASGTGTVQIVIDVEDGVAVIGENRLTLSDEETPIGLGLKGEDIILHVNTTAGFVWVKLGKGMLTITDDASPYVTLIAITDASIFTLPTDIAVPLAE